MCLAWEAITPGEGIIAKMSCLHHGMPYIEFVPEELDSDHGYCPAPVSDIHLPIQTKHS